jgi:hypothetical protein
MSDLSASVGRRVTVRGPAVTGAGGALVEVDGEPIYIQGLRRWDTELDGRQVEVTGTLLLRGRSAGPGPGAMPLHGIDEETFALDDAEWAPA